LQKDEVLPFDAVSVDIYHASFLSYRLAIKQWFSPKKIKQIFKIRSLSRNKCTGSKNDTTLPKNDATLLKNDATLSKNDTTLRKNDTTLWKNDTTLPKNDATLWKNDATLKENDATLCKMYLGAVLSDYSSLSFFVFLIKQIFKFFIKFINVLKQIEKRSRNVTLTLRVCAYY
jgi:hypothetical protein